MRKKEYKYFMEQFMEQNETLRIALKKATDLLEEQNILRVEQENQLKEQDKKITKLERQIKKLKGE